MSVLIKGREMPTSCRDCRFCNGQINTDYGVCAWCDVDGNDHDAYKMQDCPLVPVPPHGDLIDADKLVELCDIMADKCDGIGASIWHQFKTTVEWSPIVIPAEEGE